MRLAKQDGDTAAATIDLGPLPDLIGYVLRRAQLAVFKDFIQAFAAFGIRPAQYGVLIVLERNPGLKQSEVSAALGIKRANFVPLIDELERRGLARRAPAATDRRSHQLHLTEKGLDLTRQLHEVQATHEAHLAARIGEAGHVQLIELLHGVIEAVGPATDDAEEA
ncbi:MAG TPA: MarR family transcriptional regulator [Stellaceae bacterium]|nr:MarR family transcriptional regulator [Stellaceae bacterium]